MLRSHSLTAGCRPLALAVGAWLMVLVSITTSTSAQPPSATDCACHAQHATADTFHFRGVDELKGLFIEADFTLESWRAGQRAVPRFFLARVPPRWRDKVAPSLPVAQKKEYFFFTYAPLVLESNEDILADRAHLEMLAAQPALSAEDEAWLTELARHYRLDPSDTSDLLDQLLHRVDAIPPSLALAQAAVESGWSTSRFAVTGNALFGQWTWGGDGITPEEQRDGLGDYKIKAFPTPEASIAAYMHNLNTHHSYEDFRRARARLRAEGQLLRGHDLAPHLTSYSEKGEEYVETILSVIRVNQLPAADESYLRDMRPVLLVPVGPGSQAY